MQNALKKIVIVDYQLGNLFSVEQAFRHIGTDVFVTSDKNLILSADAVVLPGVGAFGDAMQNMSKLDLIQPLKDFAQSGKSFLGVCLGLQLLFTESEEFGNNKGLDIIPGQVKKFSNDLPENPKAKVPQIAWNKIIETEIPWQTTPLKGIKSGSYQYFVHSYYVTPADKSTILSTTRYEGFEYCSSILKDNVFACQFHPEKSGLPGLSIYKEWSDTLDK
jgi:glutamine amidotransferase